MRYHHQQQDGTAIGLAVGKIVCVGRNYAAHAAELNNPVPTEPLLFIKPGSCVVPLHQPIVLPTALGTVHFEAEIAVLIGQPLGKEASSVAVMDAILGVGVALDLTLRDLQDSLKAKGYPWERAKSFDGACVLSEFVRAEQIPDLGDLEVRLSINEVLRQLGNSRDMLTPIVPLITHMASQFHLEPGDVILTGTPAGVGPLQTGDHLMLELANTWCFNTEVR